MIQYRHPSGSEVVEEPASNHNTPREAGGSDSVAGAPEGVTTVVNVCGEREEAAAVGLSLVGRVGFEGLALELRYRFGQHADHVHADAE